MRIRLLLVATLLVWSVADGGPPSLAAPGGPDRAFGLGGMAVVDFGGDELVRDVARQPDGKLLVVGDAGEGALLLARLDPSGAVDRTFGRNGRVSPAPPGVEGAAAVFVVGGRIVVAATAPGPRMALLGFRMDGSVDTSFGLGGTAIVDGPTASTLAAALDGDRIVVLGLGATSDTPVARLTANGQLDRSFGVNGIATIRELFFAPRDLAIDQGRPVVAGVAVQRNTHYEDLVLFRLTTVGTTDLTFGVQGQVVTDFGAGEALGAVAAAPGGGVYLAGLTYTEDAKLIPHDMQSLLLRYNEIGQLDPRFGRAGVSRLGMNVLANDLAIDAAGRPLIVDGVGQSLGVGRYTSDGRLDASYGCGGFMRLRPGATDSAFGTALLAEEGGAVTAVGRTRRHFQFVGDILVARLAGDGDRSPCPPAHWMVASDGGVFSFGTVDFHGSTGDIRLNRPIVGMSSTPAGVGYWMVASDGGVFSFGDALFFGSTGALRLRRPVVGMAATPTGLGYWLVASDGGIFAFGDAPFLGSTGALTLRQPIVGMAPTPSGRGYWLVASDGGIFAFGDARFFGSTGALTLRQPIVGMAPTPSGRGYWLVAADGGVFTFGDAGFFGSTGGRALGAPITAIVSTPTGRGYQLVGRDGATFTFGDAAPAGDLRGHRLNAPIVGAASP